MIASNLGWGFLVAVFINLGYYAMITMIANLTAVLVDIIVYIVMSAIMGATIGWVNGLGKK